MMAFPITPEMKEKNAEYSLKWLDLYQEQVNLCHSQQTSQIKLIKKNICEKNPALTPEEDNSDVELISRNRYFNYLKHRIEHGYDYLSQIDNDNLPYNVMSTIHKAKLDLRMVLRALEDVNFLDNEPAKIPSRIFEQIQHFELSQLRIIPQPPVQPNPDNLIEEVPEEDILEPLNPETPFEFLKKINEDVYNSFAKLFNQFINEIHLIVFNKTIVDSTIEILQTPTNTLDELRNNLKEAEQKVSCFMQATDYIHQLQRMIQDL